MIGDGDSAVLFNIQANVLGWGSKVTKMECANHAVKCYSSRLEKIVQDFPKYKGKGRLTQRAIKHLTTGARCAKKMHSKTGNVEQLRQDLRNGPSHVFNDHTNCNASFCTVVSGSPTTNTNHVLTQSQTNEGGNLPVIIDNIIISEIGIECEENDARNGDNSLNHKNIPDDLFFRVQRAGDALVSKAPALISNSTSNLAECFMSIQCKFDGGKVYNRIQRDSFQNRCFGAGLRFQLGVDWGPSMWEAVTGEKPGENMKQYYHHKAEQHENDKKRKSSAVYREQRKRARYKNFYACMLICSIKFTHCMHIQSRAVDCTQ